MSESKSSPRRIDSHGWPLGICPEMDQLAARNGLAHWSCTHPWSNSHWIRRDGTALSATFDMENVWKVLREFDERYPTEMDGGCAS